MTTMIVSIIALAFLLVGTGTAVFFLLKIKKAMASRAWPSVSGELESSGLRKVVYNGVDGDSISDQASALVVDFRYRYTVNGDSFVGSRVTFSDSVNKATSSLKRLQSRYQGKEAISVYYNPENPAESVLLPGATFYNFTPLITSGLFVLAATYLFGLDP